MRRILAVLLITIFSLSLLGCTEFLKPTESEKMEENLAEEDLASTEDQDAAAIDKDEDYEIAYQDFNLEELSLPKEIQNLKVEGLEGSPYLNIFAESEEGIIFEQGTIPLADIFGQSAALYAWETGSEEVVLLKDLKEKNLRLWDCLVQDGKLYCLALDLSSLKYIFFTYDQSGEMEILSELSNLGNLNFKPLLIKRNEQVFLIHPEPVVNEFKGRLNFVKVVGDELTKIHSEDFYFAHSNEEIPEGEIALKRIWDDNGEQIFSFLAWDSSKACSLLYYLLDEQLYKVELSTEYKQSYSSGKKVLLMKQLDAEEDTKQSYLSVYDLESEKEAEESSLDLNLVRVQSLGSGYFLSSTEEESGSKLCIISLNNQQVDLVKELAEIDNPGFIVPGKDKSVLIYTADYGMEESSYRVYRLSYK